MGYLYSSDIVSYTFCTGLYQSNLLFLRVLSLLVRKLLKQHPSCYPEDDHIWLDVHRHLDYLVPKVLLHPRLHLGIAVGFVVSVNKILFTEVNKIIGGDSLIIVFLPGNLQPLEISWFCDFLKAAQVISSDNIDVISMAIYLFRYREIMHL